MRYCYDCGKQLRFTRRANCRRCWKIDKRMDRRAGRRRGNRREMQADSRRSRRWLRKSRV